jgi:protein-tyrosine phosphatase
MKILFVCTGNYYRSKFCENLWEHLLEKFDKEGEVSSSGLKPELALLWKDAFGNVSPFTVKALKVMNVKLCNDSSLHMLNQEEIYDSDKIIFINKKEHLPLLSESGLTVPVEKIVCWENEDVDEEFPMESIFNMIDNVCGLFQRLYKVNTSDCCYGFRSSFYNKFSIFKSFRKDSKIL